MSKNSPRISVVVNSFKDVSKLAFCVNALKKTNYNNKEIIVVSHGVPLTEIKESKMGSFVDKIILLDEDWGLPAQRNMGFEARDPYSQYILFVDDDVLLTESSIENLVNVMDNDPTIGIAQPLLVSSGGLIDCAGGFIDFLGYSYMLYRGKPANFFRAKKQVFPISYAAGACVILRVCLFSSDRFFRPFDSQLYFNYEDVDLSLRCWLRGFKVVCSTSAIAYHHKGRTALLKMSPKHLVYLNTRNKFITLSSVLGTRNLLTNMPLFIFFETLKAFCLTFVDSSHARSTLGAILWCILHFRQIWSRRKRVYSTTNGRLVLPSIIFRPTFGTLMNEFRFHYDLSPP